MIKEDSKILELQKEINALKAYVATELKQAEGQIANLTEAVLTIARLSDIKNDELARGLTDRELNKAYQERIGILLKQLK